MKQQSQTHRVPESVCAVKGSKLPLGLYTYDVSLEQIAMPDADSDPANPSPDGTRAADSRRPSAKSQVLKLSSCRPSMTCVTNVYGEAGPIPF